MSSRRKLFIVSSRRTPRTKGSNHTMRRGTKFRTAVYCSKDRRATLLLLPGIRVAALHPGYNVRAGVMLLYLIQIRPTKSKLRSSDKYSGHKHRCSYIRSRRYMCRDTLQQVLLLYIRVYVGDIHVVFIRTVYTRTRNPTN